MEEKRSNLRSEKQRRLIEHLVNDLSKLDPNFYYQTTSEIAHILKEYIENDADLVREDKELLSPLSVKDLQVLLSIR